MKTKLDLYKTHKAEYVTPKQPVLVRTKPAHYLAIAGQGAPGSPRFTECIGALYAAAFTIKMTRKFAGEQDYAVCKLEGQWFFNGDASTTAKDEWRWKLLIRTPEFISSMDLKAASTKLIERGETPAIEQVKLEKLSEGDCVQMLHVGPYEKEPETIALLRSFAQAKGLQIIGPHHEIYLSDPRRVPPERLKTILREPVGKI